MERRTIAIIAAVAGTLLFLGIIGAVVVMRRGAIEEAPPGPVGPGSTSTNVNGQVTNSAPQPRPIVPSNQAERNITPGPPPEGYAPPDPSKFPDRDRDGLSNDEEQKLGTDPDRSDTDGDSYSDGDEVNFLKTDPKTKNEPLPRG